MSSKKIVLDGKNLAIKDLQLLISNPKVSVAVSSQARKQIDKSKAFLDAQLNKPQAVYGINTGFGPMASHIINRECLLVLQENLIRSHAVGMGAPLPDSFVLSAMVVRFNTLIRGYSGVSEKLIKQLQNFINLRILPIIPEHGAVGTSGDLVQLAHIALALMGEGEVRYRDKKQSAAEVLKEVGLPPLRLDAREGLALINGTAVMAGVAALLWQEVNRLISLALRNGALALELVNGYSDSLSEKLSDLRPHFGQAQASRILRKLLSTSKRLRDRRKLNVVGSSEEAHEIAEEIQQVYSLRCIAQILGPVIETWHSARKVIETEINSVTDNPIIDWQTKQFIHGGNFHGEYIAQVVDELKAGVVKLTMLSERRINFFLNARLNRIFPPFMNLNKPGLTLGLQGLQFVATSTTAQSQTLGYPHRLHSISTNGDNQDVVSLGADAALFLAKVIENAYVVTAIELITLGQGIDFLGSKGFSIPTKKIYKEIRKIFSAIRDDKVIVKKLAKLTDFIKMSKFFLGENLLK